MKKVILSCLKMNFCVCVGKVGVSDRAGRGVSVLGWGIVWNTLKEGGIEKRGVETKNLKRWCKLGYGVGALKRGGRWNPFMNYG